MGSFDSVHILSTMPSRKNKNKNNRVNVQNIFKEEPAEDVTKNIKFDTLFLSMTDGYRRMARLLNDVQNITKLASYKLIAGVLLTIIFGFLRCDANNACEKIKKSSLVYHARENMLMDLVDYDIGKRFLLEQNQIWTSRQNYTEGFYGALIHFLYNEWGNVEIKKRDIEWLTKCCTNINLFITALPLTLNLSWWTNSISVVAGFISKYATTESTLSSLKFSLDINVILAIILLLVHFCNLFMLCFADVRRNFK